MIRLLIRSFGIAFFVITSFLATSLTHADTADAAADVAMQSVFQRMGQAMRALSYSGDVVYEYGGMLETLRVTHSVERGIQTRALEHLSGPKRQFEERERPVVCESVGSYLLRGGMMASTRQSMLNIDQSYRFIPRASERIASREVEIIEILPRDKHRYGMVLGIDKETGLPLKLLVSSIRDRRIIERMQYVSLTLVEDDASADSISSERRAVQPSGAEPLVATTSEEKTKKVRCSRATGDSPWQPAWLPIGFVKTHYMNSPLHGHTETFTDGLATFSIFVTAVDNSQDAGVLLPQGVANRGATSILLTSVKYHDTVYRVSVVGEIPADTARQVALSMQTIAGAH